MGQSGAERQRRYKLRKKSKETAEKLRHDTETDGPSPPVERVTEDKNDLLDQFCGVIGPKPNPRPQLPGDRDDDEKKEETAHDIETPKPPMPFPPAVWQLIDTRLRAFFAKEIKENPEMAPEPLDKDSARYMSEALGEGMAYSKVTVNPWYGFGIAMFMFALPYLLLAFKRFGEPKKKKERDTYGELAELGIPVPVRAQPVAPAPAPAGGTNAGPAGTGAGGDGGLGGALGARDAKLAQSYEHSGAPPNRENDPRFQAAQAPG